MACGLPLLEEESIDSLLLHREALPGPSLQASRPRHEEPSGFHRKGTGVLQGRASGGHREELDVHLSGGHWGQQLPSC